MAVRKVKHGRGYSYEMTAKVDGKVVRRRFPSLKEANDAYARLRTSFLDGTYIHSAELRTTLDEYVATWLPTVRVRESTMENYTGYYRRHLSAIPGGCGRVFGL